LYDACKEEIEEIEDEKQIGKEEKKRMNKRWR
jgi:hypothetical protein